MKLLIPYFPVFNPVYVAISASILSLLYVGLEQADLIPDSAWAQYPIVIIFVGSFVIMARYHLAEQDKWRKMVQDERTEAQKTLTAMLTEQRQAQVELLKLMQSSNQEMFQSYSEAEVRAFEEALEKISANYYGLIRDSAEMKSNK